MILAHKTLITCSSWITTLVSQVWVNCLYASTYPVSHCLVCCLHKILNYYSGCYSVAYNLSAAIKQLHLWNTLFGKVEQVIFRNTPKCIPHLYTLYMWCLLTLANKQELWVQWSDSRTIFCLKSQEFIYLLMLLQQ